MKFKDINQLKDEIQKKQSIIINNNKNNINKNIKKQKEVTIMTNNNIFDKTAKILSDIEEVNGCTIKTSDDVSLCNYLNELYDDLVFEKRKLLHVACWTDLVYKKTIRELLDIILQLDNIYLLEHVRTARELGEYYIHEAGIYNLSDIPSPFANYFDYESFGQDIIDEGTDGSMTQYGYVQTFDYSEGSMFDENSVVPEEYQVGGEA